VNIFLICNKSSLVSSQSSQATLLHLSQGSATAQKGNEAHHASRWESLEKVPASVVHEENALHCQYGAIEKCMRYRRISESLAQVAGVCAQGGPYTEEYWQRCDNSCREDECDDLGRRLWIGTEDVVDLGLSCIAKRRLGNSEGNVGVAGHFEIESLALVGRR
jgi:hypothetical protein